MANELIKIDVFAVLTPRKFALYGNEIEFCQKYKYLEVIFDNSGTDDKEIRSRVIQARKCIACLNGILWSKEH